MDIQTLKDRLTVNNKNQIRVPDLSALGDDPDVPMAELLDLCYEVDHPRLAFRAAWLLEYIAVQHPDRFSTVAGNFLVRLPTQKNPSCQRHFTNILRRLTHPKAPIPYKNVIHLADREMLVETVFNWLIDPLTPVAVLANCMDVLLSFSEEFEWIREELKQQIEFLLRNGSPAIQSRGKKVLEKLM
ncbi:hypothetical protein [Parapedobacter soli]|uniref:hypothetical protein n=1 Tax=Parapedobacter soli TaxID=416955 RepID=UPI0021CA9422|nr:hypothetical protein [Parapedobacter soli]